MTKFIQGLGCGILITGLVAGGVLGMAACGQKGALTLPASASAATAATGAIAAKGATPTPPASAPAR